MSSSALPHRHLRALDARYPADSTQHLCLELAPGAPAAPARLAVNRALLAWELAHHAPDVLLVTTELVQNVTQHTSDGCELRVSVLPAAILVEVADADPRPPVQRAQDPRSHGGRGLIIVAAIAHRWGSRPAPVAGGTGKVVWVELARTAPDAQVA